MKPFTCACLWALANSMPYLGFVALCVYAVAHIELAQGVGPTPAQLAVRPVAEKMVTLATNAFETPWTNIWMTNLVIERYTADLVYDGSVEAFQTPHDQISHFTDAQWRIVTNALEGTLTNIHVKIYGVTRWAKEHALREGKP